MAPGNLITAPRLCAEPALDRRHKWPATFISWSRALLQSLLTLIPSYFSPAIAGAQKTIFNVEVRLKDDQRPCAGENVHVFSAAFVNGDDTVIRLLMKNIDSLGEQTVKVCDSDLFSKLNVTEKALVAQRIKLANSCTMDIETALMKGDSQTANAKTSIARRAYQAAQSVLIIGATREVALAPSGEYAERSVESGLALLSALNKVKLAKHALTGAAADEMTSEFAKELGTDVAEKAAIHHADISGATVELLSRNYNLAIQGSLPKFLASYECK